MGGAESSYLLTTEISGRKALLIFNVVFCKLAGDVYQPNIQILSVATRK